MHIIKSFFCIVLTSLALHAAPPPTSKTFYKSPSAPLWLSFSSLPFTSHRKPTNSLLQSAIGLEGFYWKSNAKKSLGNYFGFYDAGSGALCPFIRVTADLTKPHALTPQDIVHDSAHAADWSNPSAMPLQATINFSPHIEHYGFILTNSVCIDKWITVHTIMPWVQVNHVFGLTTTNNTSQMVDGTLRSVMDFFNGTLKQEDGTSPDQQDALHYGKITDKQSTMGLADITLLCLLAPKISDDVDINIGVLAVLPTTSRPHGVYLFEPTLGGAGHPFFGFHGSAKTTFFALNALKIGGTVDATLRAGVATQEVRTASFLLDTNDVAFARYALGGKQNARRLFPLANLLTQTVSVSPGTAIEVNAHVTGQYKALTGSVGYRFTRTGAEKVRPLATWPTGTYALSDLSYSQVEGSHYTAFDLANNSAFANGGSLTGDMLFFEAAATPVQVTHTLAFAAQCAPLRAFPHSILKLGGSYSFANTAAFGIAGYGLSCSLCHTF